MIDVAPLTAEQFALREDFDERRWTELIAGKLVQLEPPDLTHGRIVLNFSKAIAGHAQERGDANDGYACFELGLIVAQDPDTVRCPAISYFSGGPRFAELDRVVTETRPALVIEVASSADRRRNAAARAESYLRWGVRLVWLADPVEKQIHVFVEGGAAMRVSERQALEGGAVLPGFRVFVSDIFAEPNP